MDVARDIFGGLWNIGTMVSTISYRQNFVGIATVESAKALISRSRSLGGSDFRNFFNIDSAWWG
jgi:hypothetical protein